MFDISGWEFLTLAIIAVIIFGPERLPKAAADLGRLVKQLKGYVNVAKDDLTRELGPEFADIKVTDLTPRGMLRKTMGSDNVFDDLKKDLDIREDIGSFDDLKTSVMAPRPSRPPLRTGELPPFDPDAT
ncbi:MAG: sec-independent translocase [Sporichthyaceae bacterium]